MSGLYSAFKTNDGLETQGVWVDYATGGEKPARFRIARAGGSNRKYGRILDAKTKPVRRLMEIGALDDVVSDRLHAEVYAESVILGWEDVTDEQGADLPFTKENCVKLLLDLPDLFRDLRSMATSLALFRAEVDREEDRKN